MCNVKLPFTSLVVKRFFDDIVAGTQDTSVEVTDENNSVLHTRNRKGYRR